MGSQASILVIDDEISVLILLQAILEEEQYELLLALNLTDARKVWRENRHAIKLVIADFRLPDGTGVDLLCEVLEEAPEMRAIVITAFPLSTIQLPGTIAARVVMIEKPFSPRDLRMLVKDSMPTVASNLTV
jgi:two-component system response regulator HydG